MLIKFTFDLKTQSVVQESHEQPTEIMQYTTYWLWAENNKYDGIAINHSNVGKWMLFPSSDTVNETWEKVKTGIKSGDLWHAKVSAHNPQEPAKYAIMIYTKDFTDIADVVRVLAYLEASGLHPAGARPIYYKTDNQTRSGVYAGGKERPWIYSSATIRSEQVAPVKRKQYDDDEESLMPVSLTVSASSSPSLFKSALKRSPPLPSRIHFSQAKQLIQDGKFFDMSTIEFDINHIDRNVTPGFADSKHSEHEYTDTVEQTLLHIAIAAKNKLMVANILECGADTAISFKKTAEHKQRHRDGYEVGRKGERVAVWTGWQTWDPEVTVLSTGELAEKTGDADIISMISAKAASNASLS